MNRVRGKILSTRHSGAERVALVEVPAAAACRRCAEGRGCGAGLFARRRDSRQIEVRLERLTGLGEGDMVNIEFASGSLLAAAWVAYGWPLAGAAAGAALALAFSVTEGTAIATTVSGLAAGVGLARQRLSTPRCLSRLVAEAGDSA